MENTKPVQLFDTPLYVVIEEADGKHRLGLAQNKQSALDTIRGDPVTHVKVYKFSEEDVNTELPPVHTEDASCTSEHGEVDKVDNGQPSVGTEDQHKLPLNELAQDNDEKVPDTSHDISTAPSMEPSMEQEEQHYDATQQEGELQAVNHHEERQEPENVIANADESLAERHPDDHEISAQPTDDETPIVAPPPPPTVSTNSFPNFSQRRNERFGAERPRRLHRPFQLSELYDQRFPLQRSDADTGKGTTPALRIHDGTSHVIQTDQPQTPEDESHGSRFNLLQKFGLGP